MIKLTLRLESDLHEKLRWLSFKEKKSQQIILVELLEKALEGINVPKEATE